MAPIKYPLLHDLAWVRQQRRRGLGAREIAIQAGASADPARRQNAYTLGAAAIARSEGRPSRATASPDLADASWLFDQVAAGRTDAEIGQELGCSTRAVGEALSS